MTAVPFWHLPDALFSGVSTYKGMYSLRPEKVTCSHHFLSESSWGNVKEEKIEIFFCFSYYFYNSTKPESQRKSSLCSIPFSTCFCDSVFCSLENSAKETRK